jgi:HD-like signal output (HDOD) protein
MTISITQLIDSPNSVYSIPAIYARLNAKLKDGNSSNAEIATLIEKDPGLSIVVLKIVNSAIYGFRNNISSINHAITILGRNELSVLLLSTGIINLFQKLPISTELLNAHWRHCLLCGLIAKELSLSGSLSVNSSNLFVAGLLHDVGKPIIWHKLPEQSKSIYAGTSPEDILDKESSQLGFTHAEVGYELMKLWALPESLLATTRWHHQPEKAKNYADWCRLIYFSNRLANLDESESIDSIIMEPFFLADVEVTRDLLSEALERSKALVTDMARLYLP